MCLGVPGRIIDISDEQDMLMGRVDFGGVSRRVCLAHVPEVQPGDYVIVHVGFAIATVDEQEAQRVFEFLQAMGDIDEFDGKETE
jgi:hydrogenase expression/formation protein HypC